MRGNLTFSLPSRLAAPTEFIFETNTPSSVGSTGLPRWPLRPPLMCMPRRSPSVLLMIISCDL